MPRLSQLRHFLQNIAQFLKTDSVIAVHVRIQVDVCDRHSGKNPQHEHRIIQADVAVSVHIAGDTGFGCAGNGEAGVQLKVLRQHISVSRIRRNYVILT